MKKILITAGGTREYIDDVRVLTNISTGKLGANIADYLLSRNIVTDSDEIDIKYQIHYLSPNSSQKPKYLEMGIVAEAEFIQYDITDVQSVYTLMEKLVPEMDVVIHCMAISDFGFKPCSTKLKSSDTDAFIDSLRERIYKTPKILPMIKKWNEKCKLVSFKFEVNLTYDELIKIAINSMNTSNSDIVIANDKAEMVQNKTHIAYALMNNNGTITETKLNSKAEISEYIGKNI